MQISHFPGWGGKFLPKLQSYGLQYQRVLLPTYKFFFSFFYYNNTLVHLMSSFSCCWILCKKIGRSLLSKNIPWISSKAKITLLSICTIHLECSSHLSRYHQVSLKVQIWLQYRDTSSGKYQRNFDGSKKRPGCHKTILLAEELSFEERNLLWTQDSYKPRTKFLLQEESNSTSWADLPDPAPKIMI